VADILRACTRSSDTVARIGGDEFVILCEELEAPGDATLLAERIVRAMPRRYGKGEQSVPIGISIGVTMNPPRHATPDDILQEADMALYRAKMAGKGRYELSGTEEDDFTSGG
jgi:diguanylate cyclase (GGDEF)-like protein